MGFGCPVHSFILIKCKSSLNFGGILEEIAEELVALYMQQWNCGIVLKFVCQADFSFAMALSF